MTIIPISGSDLPTRPLKAARLRRLRQHAKASEPVVNLLAMLALGEEPAESIVWPVPAWAAAETPAYV